ncbi:MAG TPA: FtsX-like permease family protein [Cellulomonas sp.]|nr:FtsX-like permease family protein [Cellulomonas sp.]
MPAAAAGRSLVAFTTVDEWGAPAGLPDDAAAREIERSATLALGATSVAPVRGGEPAEGTGPLSVVVPPDKECYGTAEESPWCNDMGYRQIGFGSGPADSTRVLVDDGMTVEALGLPGADEAAAALASGEVLVPAQAVWPDGTAHLAVLDENREVGDAPPVVLPALASGTLGGQFDLVLPPGVAQQLGLEPTLLGLVVATPDVPTKADEQHARAVLGQAASVYVERGAQEKPSMVLWILVVAAAVVGLGATGLAMALAAAEFRPDLATLAAVGASPRTRRRVAAAQAAVIVLLGVGLGVLTGLVLGAVLVLAADTRTGVGHIPFVVPWTQVAAIVVGVPLVGIVGAYALTRAELPVSRRLAT